LSCRIHVCASCSPCTLRPQLACVIRSCECTAVSPLSSDQLVPLHHYAHLMYPACLFFLFHIYTTSKYSILLSCFHAVLILYYIEALLFTRSGMHAWMGRLLT
jgi:hypothetical protein